MTKRIVFDGALALTPVCGLVLAWAIGLTGALDFLGGATVARWQSLSTVQQGYMDVVRLTTYCIWGVRVGALLGILAAVGTFVRSAKNWNEATQGEAVLIKEEAFQV